MSWCADSGNLRVPVLPTQIARAFSPGRFLDHTRGICGDVLVSEVTADALMAEYDAGRYQSLWTGAF